MKVKFTRYKAFLGVIIVSMIILFSCVYTLFMGIQENSNKVNQLETRIEIVKEQKNALQLEVNILKRINEDNFDRLMEYQKTNGEEYTQDSNAR